MHEQNRLEVASRGRGPSTALVFRFSTSVLLGLIAWAVGYWLARFAGRGELCAAGRSPSSLGAMLGIAVLLVTWTYARGKTAASKGQPLFRDESK